MLIPESYRLWQNLAKSGQSCALHPILYDDHHMKQATPRAKEVTHERIVEAAARGQIVGRSSQNKKVNFTTAAAIQPATGSYVSVLITKSFPNSLVGEMA